MQAAFNVICLGVGIFGVLFGLKCYSELHKWARQCQHARIAVAFKRKVQLQAPLVEWLMWCNQLDKDKDSHGRVVYRNGGVTVAITKAVIPAGRVRQTIRNARRKGAKPPESTVAKEVNI